MKNIILLHGALGAEQDLAGLKWRLQDLKTLVWSFSFSGHGKNNFDAHFGIEQFSNELENYIMLNGITLPTVFGYSMGGYVALNLAAKKPGVIHKIYTLGTKFDWSAPAVEKETRMLVPEKMKEKIPAFVADLEKKHGRGWEELVLKTAGMMHDISGKNFLAAENLKNIGIEVFLGLADKDQMVSVEETRGVFSALENGKMFMLPGSKHSFETVDLELLATIMGLPEKKRITSK